MGRALDDEQKLADDIRETCLTLQARAESCQMKFIAHLLGIVVAQATKELAAPGARSKMVGRTHTENLLARR